MIIIIIIIIAVASPLLSKTKRGEVPSGSGLKQNSDKTDIGYHDRCAQTLEPQWSRKGPGPLSWFNLCWPSWLSGPWCSRCPGSQLHPGESDCALNQHLLHGLRGPAAILFISRDACSDGVAKLFRVCFYGVSHNYRAICCKMGYRTDVSV